MGPRNAPANLPTTWHPGFRQLEGAPPAGWSVKHLREVIQDIDDGGTPSRSGSEYFGGHIPWVVIEDIRRDIYDTREHLTEKGIRNCSARLWPSGTLILSFGASIGQVGIARVPLATKQGIAGIVPRAEQTLAEYLYYLLQEYKALLLRFANMTTISEIRPPTIKELVFAFPPLAEQRKIAATLSTVDDNIQKTQQIIDKTEELKKGLMQRLLTRGIGHTRFKQTEIGEIPEEWRACTLGDLLTDIRYGTSVKGNDEGLGIPVLGIPNIIRGEVTAEGVKSAELSEREQQSLGLSDGDILLVRTNANPEYIGRCAMFEAMPGTWAFASYLIRVRLNRALAVPRYVATFLQFEKAREQFLRSARTSAGNYNLNSQEIRAIALPLPPLSEQTEINRILSSIETKAHLENSRLVQLEQLRSGLMQVLLTGRARVKVAA